MNLFDQAWVISNTMEEDKMTPFDLAMQLLKGHIVKAPTSTEVKI